MDRTAYKMHLAFLMIFIYMIKLRNLLKEILAYHAGPRKLNPNNIQFDLGALGFHVGTIDQAEYVASGKTKKGKNLPISTFEVLDSVDGLYMDDVQTDMPWEHADLLIIEFVHLGMINDTDAHTAVNSWHDVSSELRNEIHQAIDKAKRFFDRKNFYAGDEIGYNLFSSVYKNRQKLEQIRHILINQGIGAIAYPNEVEGNKLGEYSIVVLDKRMIV